MRRKALGGMAPVSVLRPCHCGAKVFWHSQVRRLGRASSRFEHDHAWQVPVVRRLTELTQTDSGLRLFASASRLLASASCASSCADLRSRAERTIHEPCLSLSVRDESVSDLLPHCFGSFRKLGVPYFGVLITRILLSRVLY